MSRQSWADSAGKLPAFALQSTHGKSVRIGILDQRHTVPVLCFCVHQLEGFEGSCADSRHGRELHRSSLWQLLIAFLDLGNGGSNARIQFHIERQHSRF